MACATIARSMPRGASLPSRRRRSQILLKYSRKPRRQSRARDKAHNRARSPLRLLVASFEFRAPSSVSDCASSRPFARAERLARTTTLRPGVSIAGRSHLSPHRRRPRQARTRTRWPEPHRRERVKKAPLLRVSPRKKCRSSSSSPGTTDHGDSSSHGDWRPQALVST